MAPASATSNAVSGAVSGALISGVLQPFDVVRTRLQTDATLGVGRPIAKTVQGIVREGGALNLWRGTGATVLRVGGGAGVHFYALSILQRSIGRDGEHAGRFAGALSNAALGASSRSLAVVTMCPVTTVKTRMEASGVAGAAFSNYRSVPQALAHICRTEGVGALWRGVVPALATNAPFSAIHYVLYRQFQQALETARGGVGSATATNFASSAAAALLATLATQPCDVFRTRAMLDMRGASMRRSAGLFAGVAPRLFKRSMQSALVWTLYEELLVRWEGWQTRRQQSHMVR